MKNRNRLTQAAAKGWGYLKDHRFSKILLKYFLLLFVCLVLPVNIMNIWYGKQQRTRIYEELVKRNEDALDQSYNSVHSILLSAKNPDVQPVREFRHSVSGIENEDQYRYNRRSGQCHFYAVGNPECQFLYGFHLYLFCQRV